MFIFLAVDSLYTIVWNSQFNYVLHFKIFMYTRLIFLFQIINGNVCLFVQKFVVFLLQLKTVLESITQLFAVVSLVCFWKPCIIL